MIFANFHCCIYSVNSEFLTPLDVAVMTNNIPMAKMLLSNGARESPLCKSFLSFMFVFSFFTLSCVQG